MSVLRRHVTPKQFEIIALVALVSLMVLVVTGAAVRLTGSGLGCPDWPRCYGKALPPVQTHALIEFSNRVVSGFVGIFVLVVFGAALRLRPARREFVWLSAMLPLGVLAQAVLGGLTVEGKLDYGYVMAHFSLTFLILIAAFALWWRSRSAPADLAPSHDRSVVIAARVLLVWSAITVVAGTAATAAGPHAGGSPGQRINRLDFDGTGTMDFVIHRHAEIGLVLGLAGLGMWFWLRRRPHRPGLVRALYGMCWAMAAQGVVGLIQYETKLPTELVGVHVGLSAVLWIAALWVVAEAGPLPARGVATLPVAAKTTP